jgi:hypothetical protein
MLREIIAANGASSSTPHRACLVSMPTGARTLAIPSAAIHAAMLARKAGSGSLGCKRRPGSALAKQTTCSLSQTRFRARSRSSEGPAPAPRELARYCARRARSAARRRSGRGSRARQDLGEGRNSSFEQLLGAKSFEQVIEIQCQYARMAYEAYVAELSKLGEMYAGLTRNAYKPVEQAAAKAGAPNRLRSA